MDLDIVSPSSAFCNGNNHLYISGGCNKKGGKATNYFWDIDLTQCIINRKNLDAYCTEYEMPFEFKNHSMIYVPNQYVFILGGNDKRVIIFDTKSKQFINWHKINTNEILANPTLAILKERYLLCFPFRPNKNNEMESSFYYVDLRTNGQWQKSKIFSNSSTPPLGKFSFCILDEGIIFVKNKNISQINEAFYCDTTSFPNSDETLTMNPLPIDGLEKAYLSLSPFELYIDSSSPSPLSINTCNEEVEQLFLKIS